MKMTRKIYVSMTGLSIFLNNIAYATTEIAEKEQSGLSAKYVFIGIGAFIIALLLFLGYKMDTKGEATTKVSHKAEKNKKKISAKVEAMQKKSNSYEADEEPYEDDGEIFDNDDFNEIEEYSEEEDDDDDNNLENKETIEENEDSLYSIASNDDAQDSNDFISTSSDATNTNEEEEEENDGESFDTSIIDSLDEEESKNSFDDTMLFNNSDFSATGNSLEDEIDNLENFNNDDLVDFNNDVEDNVENDFNGNDVEEDSFLKELKSFEEPESSFDGFSVAPKNEDEVANFETKDDAENKVPKKYTKVKKEEPIDDIISNSDFNDDFLSQMEANLKKNQSNRKSKK